MAYDPINGEKPLEIPSDPWSYYVGPTSPLGGEAGGGVNHQNYSAFRDFVAQFGRNPTQSELSMLSPSYSGNANATNDSNGKQAVAQYFNTFANSPQNIAVEQQKKYTADAPKFYDSINQEFQNALGRDATQAEKEHFGSIMAQGTTDTYTLQQFLSTLPEAVQKQDEAFRTGLTNTLQSQDAQYYQEKILPAIQAQATKSGRSLDSSGVQNSLALAAQQQNTQREGFLTNLTAQQYEGSKSLAQNAYAQAYGQSNDLANYTSQRFDAATGAIGANNSALNNYNIQKQAYDEYLQRYGKRSSGAGIGSAIGGGLGAGVGAFYGGPAGAMAGYQAGSGIGGAAGSYFG